MDVDGTHFSSGAGDDILRGGRYNDILVAGSGNDQMFGGGGADQFRFFGYAIDGEHDADNIRDLNFTDGDVLVFGKFNAGTFVDKDALGVNAYDGGAGATISSWEGIVNAVNDSTLVTAFKQRIGNDNLVLRITDGDGQVQDIIITNGYTVYIANGGIDNG
jgi:Ca2+-binding RTX toxin-like protein